MTLSPPYGAPEAPAGRRPSREASLLVALVVLAVVLLTDLVLSLVPQLLAREGTFLPWGVHGVLLPLVGYAALGAGLLVIGLDARRRLLAQVPVALAALISAGTTIWLFGLEHRYLDSVDVVDALFTVHDYLLPVLATAAWGIARRTGRWWPTGLVVVPVLVWLAQRLDDDYARLLVDVPRDDVFGIVLLGTAWWAHVTVPLILGGLACWLVATTTEARHPRG